MTAAKASVVGKDPESLAERFDGGGGVARGPIDFGQSGISGRIVIGEISINEFQLSACLRPKLFVAVEFAQIAVSGITVGFALECREEGAFAPGGIAHTQEKLSESTILVWTGIVVGGDTPGLPISGFRPSLTLALDQHHGLECRHVARIARQELSQEEFGGRSIAAAARHVGQALCGVE